MKINKLGKIKLINEIIDKLYRKNTIFGNDNIHIEFSNSDLYILERLLEIKAG